MRFCSIINCPNVVFRTDKLTRLGYCTNHWKQYSTDINKDSIVIKAIKKRKQQNALKKESGSIRALGGTDFNRLKNKEKLSKSQLLQEADKAFGDWIKQRDKNKDGEAVCPCCGYNVMVEINGKPNSGCQVLHFVTRKDYNLRFDESNAKAGHGDCNLRMHLNPNGKEYHHYRKVLIEEFGKEEVERMELSPRNINKLSEQQLKNVIEYYSNK